VEAGEEGASGSPVAATDQAELIQYLRFLRLNERPYRSRIVATYSLREALLIDICSLISVTYTMRQRLVYNRLSVTPFYESMRLPIIAVSNGLKREAVAHYNFPPNLVHVVPNGIDLERFRPAQEDEKRLLRSGKNLPGNTFIYLFVGNEFPRKGLGSASAPFPCSIGMTHS